MPKTLAANPHRRLTQPGRVRLSQVLGALSTALDMTEGQPAGHAARSCVIGMRIGRAIGLNETDLADLYYALLLKDLGCSANASKMCYLLGGCDEREAKRNVKWIDNTRFIAKLKYIASHIVPHGSFWEKAKKLAHLGVVGDREAKALIETRCERGASIARLLTMPEATAQAIRALDEHWDGRGHPDGLRGQETPILGRILCLAQTVEVFLYRDGVDAALTMANTRSGRWFEPALVKTLRGLRSDEAFWESARSATTHQTIGSYEPADHIRDADEAMLDRICWGFSQVIDAKSPWTHRHSEGVSNIATELGMKMGMDVDGLRDLRRAGLLHDIGKLGIPNSILDKPGKLTDDEFGLIKRHPEFGQRILEQVDCFGELAELAGSHHERLDGKGYYRGLTGAQLSTAARILTVADIIDALSAERPYRDPMPREKLRGILEKDAGIAFCPAVIESAQTLLQDADEIRPRLDRPAHDSQPD